MLTWFLLMGVLLVVGAGAFLWAFSRSTKPAPTPAPDPGNSETYRADFSPIPRALRPSLPLPPVEGDDTEDVTFQTISVASIIPRLREETSSGKRRRVYNLVSNVTIGRAADNDIVLSEDKTSSHHCRLEKHGVSFRLIDLGSTNKSWVNGEAKEHVVLRNGDKILIGDTTFIFDLFGDRG
ncbi:MAG: FHA domain-containing protein [Vicinamibacteria bacterium]